MYAFIYCQGRLERLNGCDWWYSLGCDDYESTCGAKKKYLETPVGFNGGVQRDKHAPHIRIQDPILVPVIDKFMYMRHRLD